MEKTLAWPMADQASKFINEEMIVFCIISSHFCKNKRRSTLYSWVHLEYPLNQNSGNNFYFCQHGIQLLLLRLLLYRACPCLDLDNYNCVSPQAASQHH